MSLPPARMLEMTAVCGSGVEGSWNADGDLIRMLATSTPMNDIISVVMISFVPYWAFKSAGITVQAAPIPAAMMNSSVNASHSGTSFTRDGAQPETKAAPSMNWPL